MDVDRPPLLFTLDLEDHRPDPSFPKRYPAVTRRILQFLEERNMRATVFVLGRLAREEPNLIKEISRRGHEIAYHSAAHIHLTQDSAKNFKHESARDLRLLSDLVGLPISGYRAPAFSLTRKSLWAIEALQELEFEYSSSVLPAGNPINGFPGVPRRAFRWPNGLLELPAPVAKLGPVTLPFLGGIYLRYLPTQWIRKSMRSADPEQLQWVYCHPHDFDHQERFFKIAGTSLPVSVALWFNRKKTFEKLAMIFPPQGFGSAVQTFREQLRAGVFDDVPTYSFDET